MTAARGQDSDETAATSGLVHTSTLCAAAPAIVHAILSGVDSPQRDTCHPVAPPNLLDKGQDPRSTRTAMAGGLSPSSGAAPMVADGFQIHLPDAAVGLRCHWLQFEITQPKRTGEEASDQERP